MSDNQAPNLAAPSGDRRAAMLDQLADHVLAAGLGGSSLRALAAAAGTSDRMLLYYFADKEAVMTAALEHMAARMVGHLMAAAQPKRRTFAALHAELAAMVLDPAFAPFMRVWLEAAARAGQGDGFYRRVGERIGRGFLMWIEGQIDSKDPARDAARLLVMVEGMALLAAIGMEDVARRGV
jgi:AcrR family transcriptional regulator